MISEPGARMPARAKHAGEIPARLAKLGATFGETQPGGWVTYTTPQGTTGSIRLKLGNQEDK